MLALLVLLVFPFLIFGAWRKMHMARASAHWPSVPGTITLSDRTQRGRRTEAHIAYQYTVEGRHFLSSGVRVGGSVPTEATDAVLARYPLGSQVTVHYSPRDHSVAALEPGPNPTLDTVFRSYVTLFLLVAGANMGLYYFDRWSAVNQVDNSEGAPVRTYGDVVAADPGLGDRLIKEGADKGDAEDEGYVGAWYLGGLEGYPKDPAQAAIWFRKSAQQGDAGSQTLLGELYAKGEGVPKDYAQAVIWLQKGAVQGNPHACVAMGMASERGLGGIPKDRDRAIAWYKKAGDDPQARQCLARLAAQ